MYVTKLQGSLISNVVCGVLCVGSSGGEAERQASQTRGGSRQSSTGSGRWRPGRGHETRASLHLLSSVVPQGV